MQVITNEQFIASKARIARYGTLLGFIGFIGGFFTSLNVELIAVSYALLIFGLFAFNVGRYNALRWGGKPRPDEILATALKGLDQRHVLLNYIDGFPASHLLLSPLGVFVIEPRIHDGEIKCVGDRWRRKRTFATIVRGLVEGGLGNPTRDTERVVAAVKSFLSQRLGSEQPANIPVEGVIVFTNPFVSLEVSDASVPVVKPGELKGHVRSVQGRTKMAGEVYRRLYEVFVSSNSHLVRQAGDARKRGGRR